jgi:hypothetical protein
MGCVLKAMGDLAAARPYYEQALEIRRRVLGDDHPNTATSLDNLGLLLQAMGDLPAARPYVVRFDDLVLDPPAGRERMVAVWSSFDDLVLDPPAGRERMVAVWSGPGRG